MFNDNMIFVLIMALLFGFATGAFVCLLTEDRRKEKYRIQQAMLKVDMLEPIATKLNKLEQRINDLDTQLSSDIQQAAEYLNDNLVADKKDILDSTKSDSRVILSDISRVFALIYRSESDKKKKRQGYGLEDDEEIEAWNKWAEGLRAAMDKRKTERLSYMEKNDDELKTEDHPDTDDNDIGDWDGDKAIPAAEDDGKTENNMEALLAAQQFEANYQYAQKMEEERKSEE